MTKRLYEAARSGGPQNIPPHRLLLLAVAVLVCALVELHHSSAADERRTFAHPGLLHSAADFQRMREQVDQQAQPWLVGWQKLTANKHSSLDWKPKPQETVYRGADRVHPENYAAL